MTQAEWFALNIAGWISLGMALEYFWMTQETLIILTVMLLLDWIFWVIDAYIQWTLQSKLMVNWLVKKLTRWLLPFIVIAVLRWAGFDRVDLVSTVLLSILIVAEWYSVIWHIYTINYGESIWEIDALKMLFKWIAWIFQSKIEEDLSHKDNKDEKKGNESSKDE